MNIPSKPVIQYVMEGIFDFNSQEFMMDGEKVTEKVKFYAVVEYPEMRKGDEKNEYT
jgi:hypothetical protein